MLIWRFEGAECFLLGLAFGNAALDVGAALGVGLAELADRGHVERVVEVAVPAGGEPVHGAATGGELDVVRSVVGGVAVPFGESADVAAVAMSIAARIGPIPKMSARSCPMPRRRCGSVCATP